MVQKTVAVQSIEAPIVVSSLKALYFTHVASSADSFV